jgi:hypothetical protein
MKFRRPIVQIILNIVGVLSAIGVTLLLVQTTLARW